MKKKQKNSQTADKKILTLLKTIEGDIHTMKNDIKMIKVDYVLKDSNMGLSLRGLTWQIEKTNKEVRKLQSDVDNVKVDLRKEIQKAGDDLTADIIKLDEKIDETAEAIQNEAKQYHADIMTGLDSIAGRVKKFDEAETILTYRQTNHEGRIKKLETQLFGKPSE